MLSRVITIADLIEEIKTNSSKWLKTTSRDLLRFSWQNGYGAFSVDWRNYEVIKKYIAGQKAHHAKIKFEDEYRKFLQENNIEFDEKYVWD